MAKLDNKALRKAVIAACREMNALGINQGTSGNVSARTPDAERFLITPSGMPYDALEPADIVEMDTGAGYRGDRLPSSEWRMHLDIYRARPEAGAVVHTHAPYATALSCLRATIPAFHYMVAVAGGTDVRCADYATFGTAALSRAMLAALQDRKACLLANHGMIAYGPTLAKALALAVEVETLARQFWTARLLGEPVILDDAEMQRVLARFRTYGKQPDELPEGQAAAVEAPVRRDAPPTAAPPAGRGKVSGAHGRRGDPSPGEKQPDGGTQDAKTPGGKAADRKAASARTRQETVTGGETAGGKTAGGKKAVGTTAGKSASARSAAAEAAAGPTPSRRTPAE